MTTREPDTTVGAPDPEAAKRYLLAKLDRAIEAQTRADDLLYGVRVDLPRDPEALAKLLDESALERLLELALRANSTSSRAQIAASTVTTSMATQSTLGAAIEMAAATVKRVQERLRREADATCQCETCKRTRGRA